MGRDGSAGDTRRRLLRVLLFQGLQAPVDLVELAVDLLQVCVRSDRECSQDVLDPGPDLAAGVLAELLRALCEGGFGDLLAELADALPGFPLQSLALGLDPALELLHIAFDRLECVLNSIKSAFHETCLLCHDGLLLGGSRDPGRWLRVVDYRRIIARRVILAIKSLNRCKI